MADYGPEGCFDWTEATRAKAHGQGTQTEGGDNSKSVDPDRASPNYTNIPFDSKAAPQSKQPNQGFPDLFTP